MAAHAQLEVKVPSPTPSLYPVIESGAGSATMLAVGFEPATRTLHHLQYELNRRVVAYQTRLEGARVVRPATGFPEPEHVRDVSRDSDDEGKDVDVGGNDARPALLRPPPMLPASHKPDAVAPAVAPDSPP